MQGQLWEQAANFIKTKGILLLEAAIITVVGMLLVRLLVKLLLRTVERSRLDPTYHKFLLSLTKYVLYLIVWVTALSCLNVDMSSIVTMLGVGGLAVSLAVQDSLSNLAGGFIILFTKPFKVGDFIEVDTLSGTVAQINTFQTKLITFDNKAVFLPNGQLSMSRITNYSAEGKRMLAINVGVDYSTDIAFCKSVILKLLRRYEDRILPEPDPAVRVTEYGRSAIQLSIRVWTKVEQYWDLNWELMEELKHTFDENGIVIPFNKLDVQIQEKK